MRIEDRPSMFELFKLVWDFIVLRDQARKGELKPRMVIAGFAYAVALYAIGLPVGLLYINHPGNATDKAILIAAIAVLVLLTIGLITLSIRWRRQLRTPPTPAAENGERAT
jgi:uncharacterized membrane protein